MNPLPNRPLINNPSAPLSLPNVPSFDQTPFIIRPRKVLPDTGKEFPIINGTAGSLVAPSQTSGSAVAQASSAERGPIHTHVPPPPLPQPQQQAPQPPISGLPPQPEKESQPDAEARVTAIFRPDDAGKWKKDLRQAHEDAERERIVSGFSEPSLENTWVDEDERKIDEVGNEDDDNLPGEGEGVKVWKAKRTLRKSVVFCHGIETRSLT